MSTKQVKISYDWLITMFSTSFCVEIDENDYWFPHTLPKDKGNIFLNEYEKTINLPEWMCIEKGLENYII